MNNVQLTGRLTRDIELRKTQSNLSVCNFSIAINNGKDEQGNDKPATFINCKAWRNSADYLDRYARKGCRLGIVGSVENETYNAKDGKKVVDTYVLAQRVEIYDYPKTEKVSQNQTMYKKDMNVNDSFDSGEKYHQESITGDNNDVSGFQLDKEDCPWY